MQTILNKLHTDFHLAPVMATEIEFYIRTLPENFEQTIKTIAEAEGIRLYKWESERGENQYEIALMPYDDIPLLATHTNRLKEILTDLADADFSAMPFPDQPGSGLHIHLHLRDDQGRNTFTREGREWNDLYSDALLHSLGGLLAALPESMPIFAPSATAEARLRNDKTGHVPSTISWGPNNRTVALRLPDKPIDNKHIEHRVPSADADVEACFVAILKGVHRGLTEQLDPGEAVYGDASLPKYQRVKLLP